MYTTGPINYVWLPVIVVLRIVLYSSHASLPAVSQFPFPTSFHLLAIYFGVYPVPHQRCTLFIVMLKLVVRTRIMLSHAHYYCGCWTSVTGNTIVRSNNSIPHTCGTWYYR